jgi:nucleoside-diphosphate-sugar epimerase
MEILISGYSGFVGSHLTDALKMHTLLGLDISKNDTVESHFNWNNLHRVPNYDAVIHLAGKAHDTANTADPESYFEVNLGLTQKIFDHFIQSSAKIFIFFSSVKAVADSVDQNILEENAAPNPLTPYGQSKLAAENYILGKKLPSEKKVYIFRPAMIHGPGNKGNLNLLFGIVQKGIPYPLGAFPNERSFMSVDNLTFLIEKILRSNIPSGVYNVCDDEPLSTLVVVELMYRSLGRKARIMNIHKSIIQRLASVGDYVGIPFNTERLKKMTESYVVSNKKIKAALAIKALPLNANDGMLKTITSFI